MSEAKQPAGPAHGELSLWDTVSIIVGIVIGSSIFTAPTLIYASTASPWEALGVWLFCGVLSLVGALCYAELATTYPRYGGDYVYLTRGFDRPMGFLFGWAQLAVILSSSTGAMAFIFGEYCANLVGITDRVEKGHFAVPAGITAVVILTALNFLGVVAGKWVQNGLVIVKLIGLTLIILAGLAAPADNAFQVPEGTTRGLNGIPTAMILVLYAFGGWNDAAFVAADLKDRRNIVKALLLGTAGITLIYLLVNFAYLNGIGFATARQFKFTLAADVLENAFGSFGGKLISVIVMISALGAMNGLIFTGSRVYLSLGAEHRVFGLLGHWNQTLKAPIWALLAQALVTIAMILTVGTKEAQDLINDYLGQAGIGAINWSKFDGGFGALFAGGAPVFWIFFLMTGFSMFALRARDPKIERPFMLKAPFYPVLPLIFCATCLFGFYAAMDFGGWISLLGFVPLFLGLPLYWLSGQGPAVEAAPTVGPAEVEAHVAEPPSTAPDDRFKAAP